MAVLQMQRINICALKKDRKQILEVLQRRGVVEPCDLKAEDELFQQSDTSQQQAQFEKNASAARQALEILNNYAPVKTSMLSSLEGRKAISEAEYRAFDQADRRAERRDRPAADPAGHAGPLAAAGGPHAV